MTTETIGTTGRNYADIASWEATFPATLTAPMVGECYNDSAFTAGVTFAGFTPSSTNTVTLTAAAGQSFVDNASVQTNAYKWNSSNGVSISSATDAGIIKAGFGMSYIGVTRLQVKCTEDGYASNAISLDGTGCYFDKCILESKPGGGASNIRAVAFLATGAKGYNSLMVMRKSGGGQGVSLSDTASLFNCTVVAPSDLASTPPTGIVCFYSSNVAKNCAVFGFTADTSGTITATTCCTDDTTPTSGFTGSLTYSSQFVNTTNASGDWKAKSGGGILDAGTDISGTEAKTATDGVGTSRPQNGSYDVGAWELVVGGGGSVFIPIVGRGPGLALAGSGGLAG
jgi:hypothetical protein